MNDDNPTDKLLVSAFVSFTKLRKLLRYVFIHCVRAVVVVVDGVLLVDNTQNGNENGQYGQPQALGGLFYLIVCGFHRFLASPSRRYCRLCYFVCSFQFVTSR